MSAADIPKEVFKILSSAGLAKDVIDLLEKKLALITDENASLHQRLAALSEILIL